jgi:fibronectin type 3 domain-containing protein
MNRTTNRWLSIILAIVMVLGSVQLGTIFPVKAKAAEAGYDGSYDAFGVKDIIDLGDTASEQAHHLIATDSQSVIGAEGETARVALPKSVPDFNGGDITFTIKVDPNDQNYFTMKLWGSDATEYRAFLAIDNQVVYPAPLVIAKIAEESPIVNRFYYSTVPIPLEKTKGKTELTVTIRTTAAYYPYSVGTFSKAYTEKVVNPSNKYYMGYVHTTASLAQEVIETSGKLTSYVPPVRNNGSNGSDLDPNSITAANMRTKLFTDVKTVMEGVLTRNTSTNNFTTATWNHKENAHGDGTMLPPYSQNDVNLYNLKYVSEAMLDQDAPEYDAMLQSLGIDNLLQAVIGAMDRLVINYLNRPSTIQTGGHQSSWGGYYQGLGEALWNVNKLFDSGRYAALGGTRYAGFDAWYNGAEKINWSEKFATVANFFNKPAAGTTYPFLMPKAAADVGAEPFITSRRSAYEEILWLNFNYARTHAYTLTPLTNQVMFQMFGAWRSNAGLLAIKSAFAENYKSALRQLYRSTGILPYYDIDKVNGTVEAETTLEGTAYTGKLNIVNLAAFNDSTQYDADRNYVGDYRKAWGLEYYMTTAFGLTRETTYVAGYGEHSDYLVHAWRLVRDTPANFQNGPGVKLADEKELLRKALLASNARAHMKYSDVDEGYRSMRLEATIEARGPFYPYDAGYHIHLSPTQTTTVNPFLLAFLKRELEKNPSQYSTYFGSDYTKYFGYATDAVGYAQQMLEDNQLTPAFSRSFASDLKSLAGYKYVTNQPRVMKLIPSTNLKWYSPEELQAMQNAGLDLNAHYDSSFYDIEDSIVYFRDEDTVYLLGFEYKSDSGLNGVSRIHAVSSDYDRIAMLNHEVQYTPSGYWNYGTPDTTVAYNGAFDPVTGMPDGSTSTDMGTVFPVASLNGYDDQIALTPTKAGSPFGGYGEFYSVQYAKYVIAMNTTRTAYQNAKNYEITLPSGYHKSTIYDKMSHQQLPVVQGKVTVPPFTAVALDLESDTIVNDVPTAPIFATGTAADGKTALTWTHSAGTDTSYEIFRSTASQGPYTKIATVDKNTNLYIDSAVTGGATYYYKVRGVNAAGKAGNYSPYAKVTVSSNILTAGWSSANTVWSLDKQISSVQSMQAAISNGKVTFTGNQAASGNLLYAYTSNLLTGPDLAKAPQTGNFEMTAEVKSGEETGILFKESLDVKSRGGFLTLDGAGNYKFMYRHQPNIVKDYDMRVDGYNIFNNINPVPVTGQMPGAKWIKVARLGLYVYAYVSVDGVDWQPIGEVGYPQYPTVSSTGENYFMDNNWHLMKTPGEFYLPMANSVYVGIASSGAGEVDHVALSSLDNVDTTVPAKVAASIISDSVNGTISINWKHVYKGKYYNVYRTKDAGASVGDPTSTQGWELIGNQVMDIGFIDNDFKAGSNGPVFYKVVAFNADDHAGMPSDLLTGEISKESVEFPASVWKSVDVNTPSQGHDLMSGSHLQTFSDGKRFWNTDGNSFRFVYQEIPAKSEGTFITRVDKSSVIGEHLGEALMVKNNVNSAYDGSTFHRAARINATKGIFASVQQSLWSSRLGTDNFAPNQDAWLRLDTHQDSEIIDVYYAPSTGTETAYPTNWTKILSFDRASTITNPLVGGAESWKELSSGVNGKWFVGLAYASGGVMSGTNFYNVAPIFNKPNVTLGGVAAAPTKTLTVKTGTPLVLQLSAKDTFGVRDLPVSDVEQAGTLPAGASFDAVAGTFTWTPTAAGTYTLPFRIQDKAGQNDFYGGIDVTVKVLDHTVVPVFDLVPDRSYVAEQGIDLQVKAAVKDIATGTNSNEDAGAGVAYSLKSIKNQKGTALQPADIGVSFNNATGQFAWTPSRLQTGVYEITFTAESGGYSADMIVKFSILGAPLYEIPEPYKTAIEQGEPINIDATKKLLLPITINDPTGNNFYSYIESIPSGAAYSANLFDWTPTYEQSLVADPLYTLKLVSYNANFRNELNVRLKVNTPAASAPLFWQNWQASALSTESVTKMSVKYGGLDNSELILNNNSHFVSPNYNQSLGRTTFINQKLTSNAEIVARITSYSAPSKYAGVMISNYNAPDPASTGINKVADNVIMALSAMEFSTSNTQSGRFKTTSVLAMARDNAASQGDFANLGFETGVTDLTKTYWVKLKYTINGDGTATVRGSYRIDGTDAWVENVLWKYDYTAAQVNAGLYGGIIASPANKEVKFDNARITMEQPRIQAIPGTALSVPVKTVHPYDQMDYTFTLAKNGTAYSSNASITPAGAFSWTPDEGGNYVLSVSSTTRLTHQAATQQFAIVVTPIDKTPLQQAITQAKAILNDDGGYTAESYAALQEAISHAEAGMSSVTGLTALNVEIEALRVAKEGLASIRTMLTAELAVARAIQNDDGQYTPDSFTLLQQCISEGDAALATGTNTQVNAALSALRGAVAALQRQGVYLTGPASVVAGNSIAVTLSLNSVTTSVYAKSATIEYDPNRLVYLGAISLVDGFTVVQATYGNGQIKLIEAGLGHPVTGNLDLLEIRFMTLPVGGSVTSNVYVKDVQVGDANGNVSFIKAGPAYTIEITQPSTTELDSLIAEAQAAAAAAPISETLYAHYKQANVTALQNAITQAVTGVSTAGTVAEIEALRVDLANALQLFRNSMNTRVSLGDIAYIAAHYGETSASSEWAKISMYDGNQNGKLDLYDLIVIAAQILN